MFLWSNPGHQIRLVSKSFNLGHFIIKRVRICDMAEEQHVMGELLRKWRWSVAEKNMEGCLCLAGKGRKETGCGGLTEVKSKIYKHGGVLFIFFRFLGLG